MRVNQTVAGHSCGSSWSNCSGQKAVTRTIDYVVFMARRNGVRRLQEVLEVQDFENERYVTNMLFDAN